LPEAPEITAVIPTHNRRPMLERAMSAALGQRDVRMEVVVVDDGSEDDTHARLVAEQDPRVRWIRHEHPLGVARARNAGIEQARAPWIAFLDDDDLWSPEKLQLQLRAAAASNATMAYGSAIVLGADGRARGIDPAPDAETLVPELLRHNAIPGGCSNVIARTDLVRSVGGFDVRLELLADWDMWLRLATAGPAAGCPDALVGYLDHPGSMHVRRAALVPWELGYLGTKHREVVDAHGVPLGGGAWFVNWAAAGQRVAGDRLGSARTYLRGARQHRSRGSLLRAGVTLVSDRLARRDLAEEFLPLEGPLPDWAKAQ